MLDKFAGCVNLNRFENDELHFPIDPHTKK